MQTEDAPCRLPPEAHTSRGEHMPTMLSRRRVLKDIDMKLYSTALSPYARKVAIVAHEHRIFERIELVPTKLTPPNAELMQHNPLNKVPTLVLDDGTALYDSIVICEYLDSVGPGPKLFPANGAARWDALRRHA